MKTVVIATLSLLMTAFVAVYHPNEYSWMRDEFGTGQIPEDPDMMFKLAGVLGLQAAVQIGVLLVLFRSNRKLAIGLAVAALFAVLILLLRV